MNLFNRKPAEVKFLTGNEACVEGALAAGCRFFAGYPITPSTEIAEEMSRRLPLVDGKFIQMEDEIASLGAVIGASLCGLKAMTATSGPGFSLKQEHIGFAALAEVPCVIVNVQRGGPSTGLPTHPAQGDVMQSRWGTHGDHPIIVLAPTSVEESYRLTLKAFNLSEKFRTPVILLSDEVIAHLREKVSLPAPDSLKIINRRKPGPFTSKKDYKPYAARDDEAPAMANFGEGYRFNVTGLMHDETGFPVTTPEITAKLLKRLHKKISAHAAEIQGVEIDLPPDCQTAILSYGSSFRSARQAAKEAGVGTIKLTTLWPFPDQELQALSGKVKNILVVEMNLGQIILEVQRVAGCFAGVNGTNIADGRLITPEVILDGLGKH